MGRQDRLTIDQILKWADAHHARTGKWPAEQSGHIAGTADEKWRSIDSCLRKGHRGLRRGGSLPNLLAKYRHRKKGNAPPRLTIARILAWADAHHARTGRWPGSRDGLIVGTNGEKWVNVNAALYEGKRGLPGGSSLARLLQVRRKAPDPRRRPQLTEQQILAWADAHHEATGNWPTSQSGPIRSAPGESWLKMDSALRYGLRGLAGKASLPILLTKHRRMRRCIRRPPIAPRDILKWADAHFARTGKWPGNTSGRIPEAPKLTWYAVSVALRYGKRGLPGGPTLARFVALNRDLRTRVTVPKLTEKQIITWIKAFHRSHGYWPSLTSGAIPHSHGETWNVVNSALRDGLRGLQGGGSLAQVIEHVFGIPARQQRKPRRD